MDDAALTTTYGDQHPYATRPQIPRATQSNQGCTLPVENVDPVTNHGQNDDVTASDWKGDFEFMQATEIDATLASMNLNDFPAQPLPQSTTVRTPPDPPYIPGQNAAVSAARNACTVLKIELDMALPAYRQSREVMQWHAANVCRVNMEYIRALQAVNRLDG